jgi:hypothetical protein
MTIMGILSSLGWIASIGMLILFMPAGVMMMAGMILYEIQKYLKQPMKTNLSRPDEVFMPGERTWLQSQYQPQEYSEQNKIKWS